jgi:hypothetical protein
MDFKELIKTSLHQFITFRGRTWRPFIQVSRNIEYNKVVLLHAMKAYAVSRGIAPLILVLSVRWRWISQHHSPSSLSLRTELRVPFE